MLLKKVDVKSYDTLWFNNYKVTEGIINELNAKYNLPAMLGRIE